MNNAELCKWLRENSSGVYRPTFVAADRIEELDEKYNALKEAVRPVVDWYTKSKRHFPDEFRPRDVALEYDGPFGRVGVICLELDALAALVGEK